MKTIYLILFLLLLLLTANKLSAQLPQLIGTTYDGGETEDGIHHGIIYKMNLDGTGFTVISAFVEFAGYHPTDAKLVQAGNNLLYGLNSRGGTDDLGCLFSFDPINNIYKDIIDFSGSNGSSPGGGLMLAKNGLLYGTTINGGSNFGVLFSFNPSSNAYTVLLKFNSSTGLNPKCTMVQGTDGKLYGTTFQGGMYNYGVIFSFDISNNIYTKLYDFVGNNRANPSGGLVQGTDGLIYGFTNGENTSSQSIVYNFNPATRALSTSHFFHNTDFKNQDDQRKLVPDLLGTKLYGVSSGCCNPQQYQKIFYINTNDQSYHEAYSFAVTDGDDPQGGLLNYNGNHFYGVTKNGGSYNYGVVFSYYASQLGGFKKLHDFTGGAGGAHPTPNLTYVPCTVKPVKPGTITGSTAVTCNTQKTYSIAVVPGATSYKWTVPSGATIQGASNTTTIKVKWGTTGGNLSVQASNACGTSSKKSLAVTVTCSGKESEATAAEFVSDATVFPNPTTGDISIKFYSSNFSKYTIRVLDITGRNILSHETNATKGENTIQLNLGKPAKGIYRVELTGSNNKAVFKVEVQ